MSGHTVGDCSWSGGCTSALCWSCSCTHGLNERSGDFPERSITSRNSYLLGISQGWKQLQQKTASNCYTGAGSPTSGLLLLSEMNIQKSVTLPGFTSYSDIPCISEIKRELIFTMTYLQSLSLPAYFRCIKDCLLTNTASNACLAPKR